MMLISRLSPRKYPWANPAAWVVIPPTAGADIDPVFLGRLAALAKSRGMKIHLTGAGGSRDTATQARLYAESKGSGMAAKPGSSWHEYGLAIDTADTWLKKLHKADATAMQTELIKFGLFKPLTAGNKTSVVEDWHIQPIETNGVPTDRRASKSPLAVLIDVETFQEIRNLTPDRIYGSNTIAKAQEVYLGAVVA
jgi:hypothetical protein